jgi:hypothetical protein
MGQAAEHKLISGHPAELAGQFSGLLWRDLLLSLLLSVAARPKPREIEVHARNTAAGFMQLH